jgi:uncharacterized protein YaaR (DUF327 family)
VSDAGEVLMLDPMVPEEYRKGSPQSRVPSYLLNRNKKNQKVSANQTRNFASAIEDKAEEQFKGEVDSFLKKLDVLEKALLDNPTEKTVFEYRNSIGSFLKKTSRNYGAMEFYKRRSPNPLKLWRTLDSDLESIYKGVVSKQLKGMMLLDKLHSVKGLIIDLKIGKEGK